MQANPGPPNPSPDSASLVKRLAGPSTNKAGLAKDQSEINRIIAEASKGSKFYENEKRKDKALTERIASILRHRDELVRSADFPKIEKSVDQMLVELESKRDLGQTIVHVDMDAFYANVELLDNPELSGKPFGVGSLYGVLCTASYDARKFGVRSGMSGFIAKKLCPDLIFVDLNFPRYSEKSKQIMAIFLQYDPNMYPAGCDEAYLNITLYCHEHSLDPAECVQQMRERVHKETQLTVSAGIAPNKMLAKICSDKNKPNGQFHLPFDSKSIKSFMHDLSIRKIPGIGRVNERLLESIGIKTCGDIYTYRAILFLMDKQFGLQFLLRTHLGIASNDVQPVQREERKSIGAERTFSTLDDKELILKKLEEVAAELENDMQQSGWAGRTLTLKYKLHTYEVFTRAKSFDRWITKKEDLFAAGKDLLVHEGPLKLRLIGLRMTKLKDLKASDDRGIKRFFESARASSPHKRHKPNHLLDELQNVGSEQDDQQTCCDEFEEAMPNFYEHEYEEAGMEIEIPGDPDEVDQAVSIGSSNHNQPELPGSSKRVRLRPPVSAPASTAISRTKPASSSSSKPRSSISNSKSHRAPAKTTNGHTSDPEEPGDESIRACECPVCGKIMQTNNAGLNAHVDFCLSRGAILEAQIQSLQTARVKQKKGRKR